MYLIQHARHTEKSFALNKKYQYTFLVAKKANKVEIKKQVSDIYNVIPAAVNTINCTGKRVSRRTRKGVIQGKRPDYKKAIITLHPGDSIDIQHSL